MPSHLFFIIFLTFSISCFAIADDRVHCLFLEQPHQNICLSKQITQILQDKPVVKSDKVQVSNTQKRQLLLSYGLTAPAPFSNGQIGSLGFSFWDPPWGRWQFEIDYFNSDSNQSFYSGYNLKLFYQKELGALSFFLGLAYSKQSFGFIEVRLDRSVILPQFKIAYSVRKLIGFPIYFEMKMNIPLLHVVKENRALEPLESNDQMILLHSVNKLDQGWPISVQIGLNYLFD